MSDNKASDKSGFQNSPSGDGGNFLVILGSGESGVGAALLAKQKGYGVFVSDAGPIKDNYKKSSLIMGLNLRKSNIRKRRYLALQKL